MMTRSTLPALFLRLGLAAIYLYASIASFLQPGDWIWYIPDFVAKMVDPHLILMGHAAIEFVLALWLLSNRKIFYAALLSAGLMLGIFVTRLDILNVVFRDLGLCFASLSLASLSYSPAKSSKK